jgi:colicin import membrane protein
MTDRSSSAYFTSVFLHAGFVAAILIFAYTFNSMRPETPKTFELVAGAGDNYGATVAPALGSADGIKLALPAVTAAPAAEPEPAPPEPPAPPVAAAVPAPVPVKIPPKPVPAKPPDKSLASVIKRAEMRATLRQEAKDRKAAEAEKRRQMTEDEFRKEHGPARANAIGISGGVVGGSIANKTGGAGGKALTREEGSLLDAYFARLKARMRENFDSLKPTDVGDDLKTRVGFFVAADGAISHVHLILSSGSASLDDAALEAVRHTESIGPRPDNQGEEISLDFAMREEDGAP